MPPFSTIRTFVKALQTGRTNITESLDRLMTNPSRHQQHPQFSEITSAQALDTLPAWVRQLLRDHGMTDPEMDHIDAWPNGQKELVRQKVVAAVQSDRQVHFLWELHDDATPANDIQDPDAAGHITIRFRSPRHGVKLSSITFGDIKVEA